MCLMRPFRIFTVTALLRESGRWFQHLAAVFLKDLSPYDFVLVRGSTRWTVLFDQRVLAGDFTLTSSRM